MPKVTFLPAGTVCNASSGESLLDVALNNDVPLQHACGGFCSCTTCQIVVEGNPEGLSLMESDERDRLESVGKLAPGNRLGCQARVTGDVSILMVNED